LGASLDQIFAGRRRLFVLSFFQNKNVGDMIDALVQPGDKVYVSEAAGNRAVASRDDVVSHIAAKWQSAVRAESFPTIALALEAALLERRDDEVVVATGSFATIKESMIALGWKKVEDGAPNPAVRSKMLKMALGGTTVDN
jgi:folylpolyglutamate synthase/dihydropteroate synthase